MGYDDFPDTLPPPMDFDAERGLLTTIGLVPDHPEVPEVLQLLTPEMLMGVSHRVVYRAFIRLFKDHENIDSLSLKAELEARGTLDRAGGYTGLVDILSGDEVLHPLLLAKRIHNLWARRQIMQSAQQLLTQAQDTSRPIDDLVQEMLGGLDSTLPRASTLLTICGAGEFLDHEPPAPRWLIPGLIPAGAPVVMASKGGVGKSFLSLQACIALATGKPFLRCEAQPPMGAVYFGLEDDKDTFHRRVRSVIGHYKDCGDWTPEDDQALRCNFAAPFINWRAKGATAYLPALAAELAKVLQAMSDAGIRPGVVIVDTLARVSEGDENTVQALRPVLNSLNLILEFGWSPLVLHHVAKGQDGARSTDKKKPLLADRMSTEWVRGSSAIVDNFRCVLQLTLINADEAAGAGLDEDKARMGGYAVFGATKLNGGQKSDWMFVEQDDHGRWFTPKDGIETLARIRGAKAFTALSKQLSLLVDIYKASRHGVEPDREALAKCHAPVESKDPGAWFRSNVRRLRNAGFLQKNSYQITAQGFEQVSRVTGCHTGDSENE